jgi:hypothetical protein
MARAPGKRKSAAMPSSLLSIVHAETVHADRLRRARRPR